MSYHPRVRPEIGAKIRELVAPGTETARQAAERWLGWRLGGRWGRGLRGNPGHPADAAEKAPWDLLREEWVAAVGRLTAAEQAARKATHAAALRRQGEARRAAVAAQAARKAARRTAEEPERAAPAPVRFGVPVRRLTAAEKTARRAALEAARAEEQAAMAASLGQLQERFAHAA